MNEKTIAIYYEHPDWFRPLFTALERRGLPFEKINAALHAYNPGENFAEQFSLFFNRMSASAYLRSHGNAIFYTRGLLASLEKTGIRVINGYEAFQIEISKALQAALFGSLGVKFPKTRVVNAAGQIAAAATDLAFPVIVKPNIGGRGAGIIKFDSPEDLETAIEQNLIDLGIDSTALVQEFAPKRGGSIQRIETLGGKFLYGLKIYPQGENFNLCPAEVCQTEDAQQQSGISAMGEMCLTDAPKSGLQIEKFEPPAEIIQMVERIVKEAKIDVGGVEYLIDDRTGDALFYDINALSNFVADAQNLIGFDPHENLVDFLEKEIEKCVTDIGCLSSAVG
jgi:glutathione synthase/RimK-type ligase-like ATP-grasp enzyme